MSYLYSSKFIEAMAKHLPPSAANLRLLDIGGAAGDTLQQLRHDIQSETASLRLLDWEYERSSVDAVVAFDIRLTDSLLSEVLRVMRPGGRFILVQPTGTVDEAHVQQLEDAGYIRILVEPAVAGAGVLIRGEKSHQSADTFQRVQTIANQDADLLDIDSFRGRYVHLLVQQRPNKPVWTLQPDEEIEWDAIAVAAPEGTTLLAFSSLPKAVSFMQPAVMAGFIKDVNKVAKFSKAAARAWTEPVLLNPTLPDVKAYDIVQVSIDPDTAEAPDE